jgi:hypothetical protein
MSGPPRWQRAVLEVQSRANPVLRAAVDREDVSASLALLQSLRANALRATEAPTRRLLHLLNLPAASDVNRLLVQIASLEREVRELRKEVADRADGTLDGPFP